MDNSPKKINLSQEQKTGFVLLSIFALLVVGLGLLQIRNTIYNPFALDFDVYEEEAIVNDTEGRLKSIDTDHDGLMDWDELNIYKTSPYLEDTDSDGVEDRVELEKNMNPLCVEQDGSCIGLEYENLAATTSSSTIGISPLMDETDEGAYNIGEDAGIFANEQTGQNTYTEALNNPDSLRQLILMTGQISEQELNEIDDDTLIKLSKNLLQQDISTLSTTSEYSLE